MHGRCGPDARASGRRSGCAERERRAATGVYRHAGTTGREVLARHSSPRFDDAQVDIARKFGRKPDDRGDFDREGFVVLHQPLYTVRCEYSNIENRLLRVTIRAPGSRKRSGGGTADTDGQRRGRRRGS